jgi:fatty acid desaturase
VSLASGAAIGDFAALKRTVKQQGLFEPQPLYYAFKTASTLGLLAGGVVCLVVFDHSWLQLANAAYLALVFGQIGYLGHDIGHRQVFKRRGSKEIASLVAGNLLLGLSSSWWIGKHDRHHAHPNDADRDPDIALPVMAFTEAAARGKRGVLRLFVKYQAYLYLPLELFGWLMFLIFSIDFLVKGRARHPWTEAGLMAVHYALYFGLLFTFLSVRQAIAFFIIQRALFGLYAGSVSAPNHKGMAISDAAHRLDYLHQQILGSRNVRAHPVTDFWYGGLNYQIEHHLFPALPRNRLRQTQRIVKAFCCEHGIRYHETGFRQSYREIFQHLQRVSAPLRAPQQITRTNPRA